MVFCWELLEKLNALCYLQSEKIWAIVLQSYIFAKNYHFDWTTGRANILCKYNIHLFSILGMVFVVSFLCYFQKLHLLACRNVLLFAWPQKMSQILKTFFKLEILIFLSFAVSFLVDMFNLKAPFLTKKHQQWNLRYTLVKKLLEINVAKY